MARQIADFQKDIEEFNQRRFELVGGDNFLAVVGNLIIALVPDRIPRGLAFVTCIMIAHSRRYGARAIDKIRITATRAGHIESEKFGIGEELLLHIGYRYTLKLEQEDNFHEATIAEELNRQLATIDLRDTQGDITPYTLSDNSKMIAVLETARINDCYRIRLRPLGIEWGEVSLMNSEGKWVRKSTVYSSRPFIEWRLLPPDIYSIEVELEPNPGSMGYYW